VSGVRCTDALRNAVARMLASLSPRARDEFSAFLLVRVHHEPRAATYPSWTLLDSKWLYAHLHLHDLCRGLLAKDTRNSFHSAALHLHLGK
jgi:hypothetical protein